MAITNQQIKVIHMLLPKEYIQDRDLKKDFVSQFTGNENKTSTKELSFRQANDMIICLGGKPPKYDNWALFDYKNKQHLKVLSICQSIGWVKYNSTLKKNLADLMRLSEWLKSSRSPIKKPLKKMTSQEISRKLIPALEGILISK
jgi:hypothetical protein